MAISTEMFPRIKSLAGPVWKNCLLGALLFWLPDLAHHCLERKEPSGLAIISLTVGMPLAVVVVYLATRPRTQRQRRSVALSMLLGIWLLGPTMIMMGWTCMGAGLSSPSPALSFLLMVIATLIPIVTLLMAGYDLTIVALLVVSVCLIGFHHTYEKGKGLFRTTP